MAFGPRRRLLDGKRWPLFLGNLALPTVRAGLLGVVFLMTWKGVLDFVTARRIAVGPDIIDLGIFSIPRETLTSVVTAFVILMLICAMYLALKRMLAPTQLWKRVIASVLYGLLVIFTVGFGYGFWWGLFASTEVSEAKAQVAAEDLRNGADVVLERLRGVQREIELVADSSRTQADLERSRGGTCGDESGPNEGPRTRLRSRIASELEKTSSAVGEDIRGVQGNLTTIDERLNSYLRRSPETRKSEHGAFNRELQRLSAVLNERLRHTRRRLTNEMESARDTFALKPGQEGFVCNDESLVKDLDRALSVANEPIELVFSPLPYEEEADATASAVEALWVATGNLFERLWLVVSLQQDSVSAESASLFDAEFGGGRNIAAFIAALGVDLALFVFVLIAPRAPLDTFENVVAAPASSLDKLLFLMETFVEKGDREAIRFWRRCMLRVKGRTFFLVPNPDLAPEERRSYLEAIEVLASVLSEANHSAPAPQLRFREAWKRGNQRLSAWGWEDPTPRHFDLYTLKTGEFREIATRLEQHKTPADKATQKDKRTPPRGESDTEHEPPDTNATEHVLNKSSQLFQKLARSATRATKSLMTSAAPKPQPIPLLEPTSPPQVAERQPTLLDVLAQVPMHTENPSEADLDEPSPQDSEKPADEALATPSTEQRSVQRDEDSAHRDEKAPVATSQEVINTLHDFDLVIKALEDQNLPKHAEGVKQMRKDRLQAYDIETIGHVGEKPSPYTHNVMGYKPSDLPNGVVAEILRYGYRRQGKILHAADVLVSEGISDRPG